MATDSKTYLDDRASFDALVNAMSEPDRSTYRSYGCLALESAFPGRKMIIYTLDGKNPVDISVITFGEFTAESVYGPSVDATDSHGITQIGVVPKRIRPRDLFLQIPQNFVLKTKVRADSKKGINYTSHYAVLVKTRSKELHQVDGDTYCVTLNNFNARFPGLNFRY